ncbi:MAG: lmo0937 family membrane protein [Vicinamibacterales bacterium]
MLMTLFMLIILLWAIGVVSSYTLGGFIHLLLVIAVGVVLVRIIQGRNPI